MTITLQSSNIIISANVTWAATAASDTYWLTQGTVVANKQANGSGLLSSIDDFTAIIEWTTFCD